MYVQLRTNSRSFCSSRCLVGVHNAFWHVAEYDDDYDDNDDDNDDNNNNHHHHHHQGRYERTVLITSVRIFICQPSKFLPIVQQRYNLLRLSSIFYPLLNICNSLPTAKLPTWCLRQVAYLKNTDQIIAKFKFSPCKNGERDTEPT